MPQFIKHVGQINDTGKKCVVIFREVPGEANNCLVVETESLPQLYHDDVIKAVESDSAQADMDFYNYASRITFHDGRNMLEGMHLSNWLRKLPTSSVTMLPTKEARIGLDSLNSQLNAMKNEGRTTSGDVNAVEPPAATNNPAGVLSDSQIANQMRSQAAYFKKEAERLFAEAEALDPQTTASPPTPAPTAPATEAKKGRGRPKKK